MIKRLLAICLLLFVFIGLRAQPYGNEWISYSQQYYKVKIIQNGVYRLDSATLASAGIDLSAIDPHHFQIFNKGIEQKIFVSGESDNVFNSGDFIEFYAEKNDGSLDVLLYENTPFIPNPYYSLVNDTAIYFLTWNNSVNGSRMIVENDTSFASHSPAVDYFFKEEIHDFHSEYYAGETDNVGGTDARYTKAEGWFGSVLDLGQTGNYTNLVNTSFAYTGGPDAKIQTVVLGASKDVVLIGNLGHDHHLRIEYGPANTVLADTFFSGYSSNRFIKDIPVNSLGSTFTDLKFFSVVEPAYTYNRTAVSYINLKYPHLPNLEAKSNFLFYLPDNSNSSKSYLNLSNFSGTGTMHVYDLTNGKRIEVLQSGSNYSVLITNSSSEKKCFVTSEGGISNITSILPVSPSGKFTDYIAVPMDSAFVIVTHKNLMTSANDYKTHRSSIAGGSHQVLIADIDELYDQFAYGIIKSPLSIRGFADFLLDKFPTKPANLFLLGKSLHLNNCRQNSTDYNTCLVPSFGNPSSDILLTAELNNTILSPAIPTGRISAKQNSDVIMYLNKIQQYENFIAPEEWMKYVLHFGGGSTLGEQTSFRNYLNSYKAIAEDVKWGGKVIKEFFKNSPAPITINSSDTLRDLINNGVTMLTFFGHASGTGFDQSIDDWSTYSPLPGRYPFLLANSCYAGDFHSSASSSELYTFLHNNGVIGYLGSVGLGVPFALNFFSSEFYYQISNGNYGKSVGSSIQKTIQNVQPIALSQGDSLLRQTCYEMNLQGDPALKLHMFDKPDYSIVNNDVYFDQTDADSVTIFARRTNLGMAITDSMFIEVLRILPSGDTVNYLTRTFSPKFKDTISITIPVDFVNGVGLNKIQVTLDRNNEINESNELNNSTTLIDLLISGGTIVPVYPYEFAIIPKDTVTLKASTANPFAPLTSYRFQFDTTDAFDSPYLKDTIISSTGGVVQWHPPVTLSNNLVYYWRVSPDSTGPLNGFTWRESSFQHIQGKRGWEQAHFFQFEENDYQYVKFMRPQRRFDFVNDIKNIYCKNGIPPFIPDFDIIYKISGDIKYVSSWMYMGPGIVMAVIDTINGEPMNNYATGFPGNGGSYSSYTGYDPPRFEYAFEFFENQPDTMFNFIQNVIPQGSYVLGYSQGYQNIASLPASVHSAFQTLGVNSSSIPDSVPYIFWGKKGMLPNSANLMVASSPDSILELYESITTNWKEGFIASPEIGPALSWDSLSWSWHSLDGIVNDDSVIVQVIGIRANGTDSVIANFNETQLDIANLSSYVNASQFPKIRLKAFMRDDIAHSAPQLDRWQVIYTPFPEAAIDLVAGNYILNDTIQQGDNTEIYLPIKNISEYSFTDSLLVTYWVEDANRINHPLPDKLKKKPFGPAETIVDTIRVNTTDFVGTNALWVEVNPVGKSRSQLEQYHFNNIIRIPFYTDVDRINPLLDVTFDGVHILNNDVVSAKPNIQISLKDENRFLALNDTNDFKVFIKSPNSSLAQRVYFGTLMTFEPAVLPNNSCRINYTPNLNVDGNYQLLVQAKDKSDNQSGAIDYKINFEVVNRSTITEVMNYPNPFSTSTRFVFTLTGSEEPTNFKIQIMTITGKVVREIFLDELGPIHIGRNITEFAWDGKDEFGDQLANGVYLYRVITRINGQDIEKRETEADQYFKKGWGKMYLMR